MSIAVVMPNYNNGTYLRQCLDSFADDEAVSEIVIYDNASTDDSVAVIEAHPSPKIRLIKGERNLFASGGRHEAIKASTQPYLSFVDGDDFVSKGMHSASLEALIKHDLDAAVVDLVRVDDSGHHPQLFVPAPKAIIAGDDGLMMTIGNWRLSLMGVFRSEIYQTAADGFLAYGYRDDELLTRRMILACRRIGGVRGSYFYRTTPRSAPSTATESHAIRTQMRAVALAASLRRTDWEVTLRLTRNETVWAMLRFLRKHPAREFRAVLPHMLSDLATIDLPWRSRDWPHWGASRALIMLSSCIRRGV